MKRIALMICCLTIGMIFAQDKRPVELSDIYQSNQFRMKSVYGMNFLKDGNYSKLEKTKIVKYNLKSGKQMQVIFDLKDHIVEISKDIEGVRVLEGYSFNADESLILLEFKKEKLYRYSYLAENYVYDVKAKKVVRLSKQGKQKFATFSPNGEQVAFVRDNNIYVRNLINGSESAITIDGERNKVINGAGDWVYEEEFVLAKAFFWSPDSRRIAYVKFDETKVRQFDMAMYQGLYPENYTFKYPKAGEDNSEVTVHYYDLNTRLNTELNLPNAYYVPRIKWTKNANIFSIQTMNRHQNQLDLILYDCEEGASKTILHEENPYYIDVTEHLTFLDNGTQFIWSSEADSFYHFYLYDLEGKMIKQLTKGDWDITDFYGYDEKSKQIYYQSSEPHATQRAVYAINVETDEKVNLTPFEGTNRAIFNSKYTYFLNYYSNINTPQTVTLYKVSNQKEVGVLEKNAKLDSVMNHFQLAKHEFIEVPMPDGTKLNGRMIKPANFDPNKKYPLFMYVYGGPGSQTVNDEWGRDYFWYNHLTSLGYIVVSVDNRGTGARGQEFKKCTYLQLGKIESEDQIEAAKYLGTFDYIDADRMGIFGWSYGGYMSSLCLFKGNDVFKMAIAVAPVTNWKFYDSIYTERYMRTPKENKEGYEKQDPLYHADKLKGKYLLIHGTADDNVHFQNAVELVEVLIQKNKQFDTMYYPNKNHSIYGGNTRNHLYTLMTNYIKENL